MVLHNVFGVTRDIDIAKEESGGSLTSYCDEVLEREKATLPHCEHGWMKSCYRGYQLHYRKMLPPSPPKAIIIWMHGLNSHGGVAYIIKNGRRFGMALQHYRYVQQEGYALYTLDLMGYGFSEGDRGIMPNYEVLVQDYINFVGLVRSFHEPPVPLFLTGGSFGATLTLHVANYFQQKQQSTETRIKSTITVSRNANNNDKNYPCKNSMNIDSLILFAPAVVVPSWFNCLLLHGLILVLRWFIVPFFPTRIPSLRPYDPKLRWKDPEVLQWNIQDKLRRFDPRPMQTNWSILCAIQKLFDIMAAAAAAKEQSLPPYCIIHGDKDQVVDVDGPQYLTTKTNGIIRQLNIIPGALHDLIGDPSSEEVMEIAIQWTRRRLKNRTSIVCDSK